MGNLTASRPAIGRIEVSEGDGAPDARRGGPVEQVFRENAVTCVKFSDTEA